MTSWKSHWLYVVPLAAGAGLAAVAVNSGETMKTRADADDTGVKCEIEVEALDNGVQLRGVVMAGEAIRGVYELVVSKSGGGGSSNLKQSGRFDTEPDRPAKLGVMRVGGSHGSSYKARLTVSWDDNEIACDKLVGGGWL